MTQRLRPSIARIHSRNEVPFGVGFLVTKQHMLTCEHVVRDALGLRIDDPLDGREIKFDFPFVLPRVTLSAKVVYWDPKLTTSRDIAGLEIIGVVPDRCRPARLIGYDDIWGHQFRGFGFPEGAGFETNGLWAQGVFRDHNIIGRVQIADTDVEPGFSGTAAWDHNLRAVVGMVSEVDIHKKVSFATTAKQILDDWPELKQRLRLIQVVLDRSISLIEVGLRSSISAFNAGKFIRSLESLLKTKSIKIRQIRPGSITVRLEMSTTAAEALLDLHIQRNQSTDFLEIESVNLLSLDNAWKMMVLDDSGLSHQQIEAELNSHFSLGTSTSRVFRGSDITPIGERLSSVSASPDGQYVVAIDQGTTSTRCMLFDHSSRVVGLDQKEHAQIYPRPGWAENDPMEIWQRTQEVISGALQKASVSSAKLAAIGVANQRETTVVWEKATGRPVYNAITWQDTRTDRICNELAKSGGQDRFRSRVGLPLATYFSGPKIKWILDNVPGVREKAERGEVLFGNIDSWLIWNLTGGPNGGVHVTDVSNASRTMLMSLETLNWDEGILQIMGVPRAMLPEVRASSDVYGTAVGSLTGVPVAGDLGDQQAALLGQTCFSPGEAKNTYGTGCFMLLNTGVTPVQSKNGLLTTVGYKIGNQRATYALEGSIAITGALVQWLRDNLGMIRQQADIESLANSVEDNGGIYIVPAFSGLFAPYWKSDARGAIVGLTRYINRGHFARAALEATAYQTRDVLDAMTMDSGIKLQSLKVDGGMIYNDTLMQFQADILGVPVVRPTMAETTSLGAAYAAGLAVGFWSTIEDLRANWNKDKEWTPKTGTAERERLYAGWKKAITRTFDWVE